MSRTWSELFGDEPTEDDEPERSGFFGRLRDSLAKSRRALTAEIAANTFDAEDEEAWERLEEALIHGDVGVRATAEIVRRLEARGELGDLGEALAEEIEELFGSPPTFALGAKPAVILVVGVNGTGKTTTVGKLAQKLREHGRSVLVRQPRSSSRSGPSARAPISSAHPRAAIRLRSPTTRSRPGGRGRGTSSSSTPPGACTRSRT